MARTFATQNPLLFFKFFQHIAVADLATYKCDTAFFQGEFHRHIGHQGSHRALDFFSLAQSVIDHQVQQLVTVKKATAGIDQLQPIGISI